MIRFLVLATAGLAGLAGCVPQAPWVEVGTGDGSFAALEDGDVLDVENGAQGGRHVWVGLRAGGVNPGSVSDGDALRLGDRPLVNFRLEGVEGVYSLDVARFAALDDDTEGYVLSEQLLPFRLYAHLPADWQDLDWTEVERDLGDQEFDLVATLTTDGEDITDRRAVRLRFPERSTD